MVLLWHLIYWDIIHLVSCIIFGRITYHYGWLLFSSTIHEYYRHSVLYYMVDDNTIHEIMDISYCIILLAILVHIEAYIIWIWNIRVYQLLRYFMYSSISYGTVMNPLLRSPNVLGCILYGKYFAYYIILSLHLFQYYCMLHYIV